jgi:hypothetical protein
MEHSDLIGQDSPPLLIPLPHCPPNAHGIISFTDPHPLSPGESYRFKNGGGMGVPQFKFFPYVLTSLLPYLLFSKFFICNTYESPRKCCKQKTYGVAKPFRCNTYKKQGGWSVLLLIRHPMKDVCPERPSGVEGPLFQPMRNLSCPPRRCRGGASRGRISLPRATEHRSRFSVAPYLAASLLHYFQPAASLQG